MNRPRWLSALRRGSAAAHLLKTAGSNPTGSMNVCLLCECCVVRQWCLRPAHPSSSGVLPNVCMCTPWSVIRCNKPTVSTFHVHGTAHRSMCILYNQRAATYTIFLINISALHISIFPPIINDNTQGCTYSFISS
jgi:hypothetical protein